jgi:hypothetical protein
MLFSIKITSEDGEIIEIGKEDKEAENNLITEVTIHMDTVNNDVSNKSNAMLAKIKICGVIDEIIGDELLKIFQWSKALKENQWYRTIEIKIKTSMEKVYRNYSFEKVFVVDYIEIYKTEKDSSQDAKNEDKTHFELYLTQKENYFKTIEAY